MSHLALFKGSLVNHLLLEYFPNDFILFNLGSFVGVFAFIFCSTHFQTLYLKKLMQLMVN